MGEAGGRLEREFLDQIARAGQRQTAVSVGGVDGQNERRHWLRSYPLGTI
jgi:hypothetical protein